MNDIVIIPTYARPDYLWLCLEHLERAAGDRPVEFWVFQDKREHPQFSWIEQDSALTRSVVAAFPQLNLRFVERKPHSFVGNPLNFLEAYKEAHATDARYIYLVEDDVLVAPDFFQWHEAVQARADYFVTVGWHNIRNRHVQRCDDPTAYIETTVDYSSIGVCWRRESLAAIVRHAHTEYYKDMAGYLRTTFPGNPIPCGQWTEQAGIIMRELLQVKDARTVAWPCVPRCAHVGTYGYHRYGLLSLSPLSGNLQERVAVLREITADPHKLAGMVRDQFKDIEPLSVIPEWRPEELHVVQSLKWVGEIGS